MKKFLLKIFYGSQLAETVVFDNLRDAEEEMHRANQNGNRYDPCEYFIEEQII